jgi:hypothetical protein
MDSKEILVHLDPWEKVDHEVEMVKSEKLDPVVMMADLVSVGQEDQLDQPVHPD